MKLAQLAFTLAQPATSEDKDAIRSQLLKGIEEDGRHGAARITRLPHADSLLGAEMAPWFQHLTSSSSSSGSSATLPADDALLSRLQAKNKEELDRLQASLEDAQLNLGETEISDALRAKALYLARIGDKVRSTSAQPEHASSHTVVVVCLQDGAIAAHQVAIDKTAGLGSKIDLRLAMIRIGLFHGDHDTISSNIEKAQKSVAAAAAAAAAYP